MSFSPVTSTVTWIFDTVSDELHALLKDYEEGTIFQWFQNDLILSIPNSKFSKIFECIANIKTEGAFIHMMALILNKMQSLEMYGFDEESELFLSTISSISCLLPINQNDANICLILSQLFSHSLMSSSSLFVKNSFGRLASISASRCNNLCSFYLDAMIPKLNSDNFSHFISILKYIMVSKEGLISFIDKLEIILNKVNPKLLPAAFRDISLLLFSFLIKYPNEYRYSLAYIKSEKATEMFQKLKKKYYKETLSWPSLIILIPFILQSNINNNFLDELCSFFRKVTAEKWKEEEYFSSSFMWSIVFYLCRNSISLFKEVSEKLDVSLIKHFLDAKGFNKFPHLLMVYTAYQTIRIQDLNICILKTLSESDNRMEFLGSVSLLLNSFPMDHYQSVIIKPVTSIFLSSITTLINITNETTEEEIKESYALLRVTLRMFVYYFDLNDHISNQNIDAIVEPKDCSKEMETFFKFFPSINDVHNIFNLSIKLIRNNIEKTPPELFLLMRNIFLPFKRWRGVELKGTGSILYDIGRIFHTMFAHLCDFDVALYSHILNIFLNFVSFCYYLISGYEGDTSQEFTSVLQSIFDSKIFANILFKGQFPEYFVKLDNLFDRIEAVVKPTSIISMNEETKRSLLKIPFRLEKPSPMLLRMILPMLDSQSKYIDNFISKLENYILSENFRDVDFFQALENTPDLIRDKILTTILAELKEMNFSLEYKSINIIMNMLMASTSLVSKAQCSTKLMWKISAEFFKILYSDPFKGLFKTICLSICNYIDALTKLKTTYSSKRMIVMLTEVLQAVVLTEKPAIVVAKGLVRTLGSLMYKFSIHTQIKHCSTYRELISARRTVFSILQVLKDTAYAFKKANENLDVVKIAYISLLNSNFEFAFDLLIDHVKEHKHITNLIIGGLDFIKLDQILKHEVKIEREGENVIVQNEWVRINFEEIAQEENPTPRMIKAILDYVWCLGLHRDLLKYMNNHSNETIKSLVFRAYITQSMMDNDFFKLYDAFKRRSVLDFINMIKISEDLEFFLRMFKTPSDRVGMLNSFFILPLLDEPILFGVSETERNKRNVEFVDELQKSNKFLKMMELQDGPYKPHIKVPDYPQSFENVIKYYGEKREPSDNFAKFKKLSKVDPMITLKLRESQFITEIPDSKNSYLIEVRYIPQDLMEYVGDFINAHFPSVSQLTFVIDFASSVIKKIDLFKTNIDKIWETNSEKISKCYLLNITNQAASFIKDNSEEPWISKIDPIGNVYDIFKIYPNMILPSASLPDRKHGIRVTTNVPSMVFLNSSYCELISDGNILDNAIKRQFIWTYSYIDNIKIQDTLMTLTREDGMLISELLTMHPDLLANTLLVKKGFVPNHKKAINIPPHPGMNRAYVIGTIMTLLASDNPAVTESAVNLFNRIVRDSRRDFSIGQVPVHVCGWRVTDNLKESDAAFDAFVAFCQMVLGKEDTGFNVYWNIIRRVLSNMDDKEVNTLITRLGNVPHDRMQQLIYSATPHIQAGPAILACYEIGAPFSERLGSVSHEGIMKLLQQKLSPEYERSVVEALPNIIFGEYCDDEFLMFIMSYSLIRVVEAGDFQPFFKLLLAAIFNKKSAVDAVTPTNDPRVAVSLFRHCVSCFDIDQVQLFYAHFMHVRTSSTMLFMCVFLIDSDGLLTDIIGLFEGAKPREIKNLIYSLEMLIEKHPERAAEAFSVCLRWYRHAVLEGVRCTCTCLRLDPGIVEGRALEVAQAFETLFVNRLTVGQGLKFAEVLLRTQKLDTESAGIFGTFLLAFSPDDDSPPVHLSASRWSVSFLFKALMFGQTSVRQTERILDFLVSVARTNSVVAEVGEEYEDMVRDLLISSTTLRLSRKLSELIQYLRL